MAIEEQRSISESTSSPSKKVALLPLIFIIYFEVAGGPYGEEPAVKAAGPLLAILGFLIFPFIWSVPEALMTAELSTTFPGNGGYVIWVHQAFGPFLGSLMGTWKFFSAVINLASFPALGMQYIGKVFPILASGHYYNITVIGFTLALSILNYTGLNIVGYTAVALGLVSLAPFMVMSSIAIPRIQPSRWISLGQPGVKKDWNLFFNTLFWNLNFWDLVSTMAGEVENPQKNFPLGLLVAVIFTCLGYLIPLLAVTGALSVDQRQWDTGFMANAAQMISGKWLTVWIEVGAVLSAIGLFEAQMSSSAYQLEGMAEMGFLPKFFGSRCKQFATPWVGIAASTAIAIAVSFMEFDSIVSSANFLYSLGMLLEFASFIWLRRKFPLIKRPFRVPLRLPGLIFMFLAPSAFLVLIMVIATKLVFVVSAIMTAFGIVWYFVVRFCQSRNLLEFNNFDTKCHLAVDH